MRLNANTQATIKFVVIAKKQHRFLVFHEADKLSYEEKKKKRQRFIRDGACNKRTLAFSFAFVRPLLHFLVYFSVRECLQERLISSSAVADAVVTTPCNAKEIPRRDKRERKKRQSMAVARSAEWQTVNGEQSASERANLRLGPLLFMIYLVKHSMKRGSMTENTCDQNRPARCATRCGLYVSSRYLTAEIPLRSFFDRTESFANKQRI